MTQEFANKASPQISIGLPVYNGADYVGLAIKSILEQTYRDFELVICDNASTDDTESICREFANHDERITYIRHPENLGAVANFRAVFELGSGKYFKWHGHDDLLAPKYLECLVEVLDADPSCALVYPRSVMIDELGAETFCFLDYFACDATQPDVRLSTWLGPARDDFTNPFFGLIRRDVLTHTDLLAPYLASDRTLLAHLSLLGRSKMVTECLFLRRLHRKMSTIANMDRRSLREWFDGRRPLLVFKQWRLLYEYLKLINKTPIGMRSRLRCYGVMVRWAGKRKKKLLAELMLPLYLNGRRTPLAHALLPILGLK